MENSEQVNQVFQSLSNPVVQKSSNFLIIFLSVLLFISVSIAGFFAYQTQKLAKELTAYSVQKEQQTPKPTYEPGLEPEEVPLEVLTVGWKFFSGKNIAVSFYYPNNWGVREAYIQGANSSEIYLTKDNSKIELIKFNNSFVPGTCEDVQSVKGSFTKVFNYDNELARVLVYNSDAKSKAQTWKICSKNSNGEYIGGLPFFGYITISVPINSDTLADVDQILSTFKFTN